MSVLETDEKPDLARERIMAVAQQAVEEDGAEVIVLGCAGMVGYAQEAAAKLGVVVIDPTSVTLKITEAMVEAGLVQSKRAFYATPPEKEIK